MSTPRILVMTAAGKQGFPLLFSCSTKALQLLPSCGKKIPVANG